MLLMSIMSSAEPPHLREIGGRTTCCIRARDRHRDRVRRNAPVGVVGSLIFAGLRMGGRLLGGYYELPRFT
jgi:hypothetical protein